MSNFNQTFNIIKQRGTPTEATTIWGFKVEKQDKIFVIDMSVASQLYTGFIPAIDYDNHFIYEVPDRLDTRGYPAHMCTCGSFAVVIVPDSYETDMSRGGLYFGCFFRHLLVNEETGEQYGKHADGST